MKKIFIVFILPVVYFLLISCNSLNNSDTATVTIDTGIRRTKAEAPSDVTSISVTISGSGMSDITESVPTDTGVLTLEVPIGTARLFSVTALAGNFTYLGSTTQDIAAGETVVVSISMVRQAATANLDISDFHDNTPARDYIDDYTVTITDSSTSNSFDTTASPASGILNNIEVPAGSMDISVSANIDASTNQSALTAAGGSTSATFIAGETQNLTVNVGVTETRLIFPNPNNPDFQPDTPKLVQLDSINDSIVEEVVLSDLTTAGLTLSGFYPWDVDYDSYGKIYIANNDADDYHVIRIDNFSNLNPIIISIDFDSSAIKSVAIDRLNNFLYYSSGNNLQRVDLSTASFPDSGTSIDISSIGATPEIVAIGVDDQGMLYLSAAFGLGTDGDDQFIKFNPNTPQIIGSPYTTNIDFRQQAGGTVANFSDIIFKSGYIYLANYDGIDNNLILQFDADLNLLSGFGIKVPTPQAGETWDFTDNSVNHYYGPHFFVGIKNDEFYIMDEMGSQQMDVGYDKLIAMDDLGGIGWEVNESFDFFYDC